MSDLGAIFHVKKDGTQYDAHAYTTTDECPEPNLKIKFNGSAAYIKLEAKGSGDVPCYVKLKSESTMYQVRKEAVPTGEYNMSHNEPYTLKVPAGVKVIKIVGTSKGDVYVGVSPGSTHTLIYHTHFLKGYLQCQNHNTYWVRSSFTGRLQWSPEINKETPTITDY